MQLPRSREPARTRQRRQSTGTRTHCCPAGHLPPLHPPSSTAGAPFVSTGGDISCAVNQGDAYCWGERACGCLCLKGARTRELVQRECVLLSHPSHLHHHCPLSQAPAALVMAIPLAWAVRRQSWWRAHTTGPRCAQGQTLCAVLWPPTLQVNTGTLAVHVCDAGCVQWGGGWVTGAQRAVLPAGKWHVSQPLEPSACLSDLTPPSLPHARSVLLGVRRPGCRRGPRHA